MARPISSFRALLMDFGPLWVAKRLAYSVLSKIGYLEFRAPITDWDKCLLKSLLRTGAEASQTAAIRSLRQHPWVLKGEGLPAYVKTGIDTPIDYKTFPQTAGFTFERLRDGEFCFFQSQLKATGVPIRWHVHPVTQQEYDKQAHWSRIADFGGGDIKWAWELGRFSFVFALAREYQRTENEDIPHFFWSVFLDWKKNNQPNSGIHWKCGQEVALRLIAISFGLRAFQSSPATTDNLLAEVLQFIAVSARRIEANIGYALQQKNNHGISEAAGLWTAALLCPTLRRASYWKWVSKRHLTDQAIDLLYTTGNCSQHSLNYLRLILHLYAWCLTLGDQVAETPFLAGRKEDEARNRLRAARDFILSVMDRRTGHTPRFGANDSALLFQLTDLDSSDFRPALQTLAAVMRDPLPFPSGPWDTERFWLCGDNPPPDRQMQSVCKQKILPLVGQTDRDGLVVMRDDSGFLTLRAQQKFVHRPSHADLLHVDVFWKSQKITIDPGTYSYNSEPPWDMPFKKTGYHNTVSVDEADQMERFSRFIWSRWPTGRIIVNQDENSGVFSIQASHSGYRRRPYRTSHTRTVFHLDDGFWAIHDRLHAEEARQFRLHWLFTDFPFSYQRSGLVFKTPKGDYFADVRTNAQNIAMTVVRASESSPRGWFAPHYGTRAPAISVDWVCLAREADFLTVLSPANNDSWGYIQRSPISHLIPELRFSAIAPQ